MNKIINVFVTPLSELMLSFIKLNKYSQYIYYQGSKDYFHEYYHIKSIDLLTYFKAKFQQ